MRRRALLAVPLLVACASADAPPPAATSPAATSPAAAPAPATTSRLETRLTVEEATRLGAPVRLRLELVNATGEAWSFDDQQAGLNGSLEVTGPDGARVPYVGPSCQTCGGPELLPSGETAVLFSGLDLGGQYPWIGPGATRSATPAAASAWTAVPSGAAASCGTRRRPSTPAR